MGLFNITKESQILTSSTITFSLADRLCLSVDTALRTLFGQPQSSGRTNPAEGVSEEASLNKQQQREVAGMMRVNHCGEVCAQALYQGQALTARDPAIANAMHQASIEENDHLLWCEQRLNEFSSHKSYLNPFWYTGSFAMGVVAGIIGDKVNLGFLAETERQVVAHLESHLERLPAEDHKSRTILEQMKQDELHHATQAVNAGGIEFALPVKWMMKGMSKVMTSVSYYI